MAMLWRSSHLLRYVVNSACLSVIQVYRFIDKFMFLVCTFSLTKSRNHSDQIQLNIRRIKGLKASRCKTN